MPKFSDAFLSDLRERVAVSEVVGRDVKLRRQGAEFVAVDDHSLTVNDRKQLWFDHGRNRGGGDVFKWLTERRGVSFQVAVETVASMAGLPMPETTGRRRKAGGAADADPRPAPPPAERSPQARGKREIVRTFDYVNGDDVLLYQVCRMQWRLPDGGWVIDRKGKPRKSFGQRRPAPGESDVWIWGLDAGEYSRRAPGDDWYRYDEDRFTEWRHTERRFFDDDVAHTLYRMPAVRAAVAEGADGPLIFLPEGEKKVELLESWGLVATCASGGAGNWSPYHAEALRGADVVVMPDNDEAGRKGAYEKARSLRGIARRIRMLDIAEHWPACPEKGDIEDWAEQGGGSVDQLYEIVDRLHDWKPQLKVSKFGRVRWTDRNRLAKRYRWLVKGMIPAAQTVFIWGQTNGGKSFFTCDLAMHVAEGKPYRGRPVEQGLVVYCAMEAGDGFPRRMQAYAVAHPEVDKRDDIPFEMLTKKADLFSGDVDTDSLIAEIAAIADEWDMPVAVVVIDTYQAATPGMKEIASEDVSRTTQRLDRIRETFGCGIWVVHHPNKQGNEPSGHQSIINGIETSIQIRFKLDNRNKVVDAAGRAIRECVFHKQREGELPRPFEFTLPAVRVGYDQDGDDVTSCYVEHGEQRADEAMPRREQQPGFLGFKLLEGESAFMRALLGALEEYGVPAVDAVARGPDDAERPVVVPEGVETVVDYAHVRRRFWSMNVQEDEDQKRARERVKQALARARKYLSGAEVIASDNPFIWPTGKRVRFRDGSVWPSAAPAPALPPPAREVLPPADEDASPVDTSDFGL